MPRPGALVWQKRRPLTRRRRRQAWCSSQGEHDRGRQRLARDHPGGRIRHRRGSARRKTLDQESTGPSGAGPKGNRGTSRVSPKLEARRQARFHPSSCRSPVLRRRRAAMEATARGESRRWGDSGIVRFRGCSYRNVGCRSWVDASSLAGRSAPQGAWSHDRVV